MFKKRYVSRFEHKDNYLRKIRVFINRTTLLNFTIKNYLTIIEVQRTQSLMHLLTLQINIILCLYRKKRNYLIKGSFYLIEIIFKCRLLRD